MIHLREILSGRNTLYVVQPLKSTQRFSVVFGGLLGALVKDQAYEASHLAGEQLPNLLVVIDEAYIDFGGDCVYRLIDHVLAHVERGEPLMNDAGAYLTNLRLEEAVYRSAATGCKVTLDDVA